MIRFAKIGRLYKLVKLTRLLRVFKLVKQKGKAMKFMSEKLPGMERMFFFVLLSIVMIHIQTCLWVMLPQLLTNEPNARDFYKNTWIQEFIEKNYTDNQLYWTSFYWVLTTVTTVGYGDIKPLLIGEKIYTIIAMIIGVMCFTFANGSLASILSHYDAQNAVLQDKIVIFCVVFEVFLALGVQS